MCPERHGGDRRGQGPLLLGVGVAASPGTIRGIVLGEPRSREMGRDPAVTRPPGQVLKLSE